MTTEHYDFSGWATKNDVRCSDGRTIRSGAFRHPEQKMRVPLMWMHDHTNPKNLLGHADLEFRPEGVYAYCSLNKGEHANSIRDALANDDIEGLSIFANQLTQHGGDVIHGNIRELSVVIAGANPQAYITEVLSHASMAVDDDPIVYISSFGVTAYDDQLQHAEKDESDDNNTKDEETKPMEKKEKTEDDELIEDVLKTMTPKQYKVCVYLVQQALDEYTGDNEEAAQSAFDNDYEGEYEMRSNIFAGDDMTGINTLTHSDIDQFNGLIKRAKDGCVPSLKQFLHDNMGGLTLAHADASDYGVDDIQYLFPDAKNQNMPPEFISREMTWVQKVLNGTHHVGMSRVKCMYANITEDEARARGYIKGHFKKEEVFSLLKRTTTPCTIYKKQKLDREDMLDITDFNVMAWLKTEMRTMLDEEIARAILIGDGRLASDEDKINENCLRPIASEADLFNIKYTVGTKDLDNASRAERVIEAAVRARKDYRGSGTPVYFTTEEFVTESLLLKDKIGRKLYNNEADIATAMRVSALITVPVMEGATNAAGKPIIGIELNLDDYQVGADNGASVSMFEDFDINYNQQIELMETRISGALRRPFSAITYLEDTTSDTDTTTGFSVPTQAQLDAQLSA